MTSPLRRRLHASIPSHFQDPLGLAARLVKSRSPAAMFAMGSAALELLVTPLDVALQPWERRIRRAASPPRRPLVFVVGPPRSGTTLLAQSLIAGLPVAYLNNWTGLFPRSPIAANRLFRTRLRNERVDFTSYYGRTTHLYGVNDGLQLWDRWLGADRTRAPERLSAEQADGLRRFFGGWEAWSGRPVVNKNNGLVASAHLVAEALETAHFLCLEREPLFLAQSLLVARRAIHGRDDVSYGIDGAGASEDDPLRSVCRQARFYADLAASQQQVVGAARFWRVSYERFCADPAALVERVGREILGAELDAAAIHERVAPFRASRRRALEPGEFQALESALADAFG